MQSRNSSGNGLPAIPFSACHDHSYFSDADIENERRTWWVIALASVTMAVEIVSGWYFGSMALLADGWHMASHASALGITAVAYSLAMRHKDNPRFTFGTGKIGDLAGFSSALLLLFIALLMAYESALRFFQPVAIRFNEAMIVAAAGLLVNLASAFLLREHVHHHEADPDEEMGTDDDDDVFHDDPHPRRHHHDQDHNLKAAYLHVLADAFTSILAIAALMLGKYFGWRQLDPAMGIVGAMVIARWSFGLMHETGAVLLDWNQNAALAERIERRISGIGTAAIEDLHIWRLYPGHYSVALSLSVTDGRDPVFFKGLLSGLPGLSHLIVEVNSQQMGLIPDALEPERRDRRGASSPGGPV